MQQKTYLKIETVIIAILILAFILFVAVWESHISRQNLKELESQAKVIDNELWNYDDEGALTYLQMASRLNNYQTIELFDSNNRLFVQVDGQTCNPICSFLVELGVIPVIKQEIDVTHKGKVFGKMVVYLRHDTIFVYFYAFLIFGLILVVAKLFFRILKARSNLESRVRERTLALQKSQQQLAQEKRFIVDIIQSMVDSVIVVDPAWNIDNVNAATCSLIQRKEHEIIGQSLSTVLQPKKEGGDLKTLFDWITRKIRYEKTISDIDVDYFSKDGEKIPMSLTCSSMKDSEGDLCALVLVARDMRGVKLIEQLNRAKNIAEVANKSKSEFLANMSHELRTPMHAILSFSDMGKKRIDSGSTEKLLRYFSNINESGHRLLTLLNDLLDLSKLEAKRMQFDFREHDLNKVIEKATNELVELMKKKSLTLELDPMAVDTVAHIDPDKMLQVFLNLLSNAIKFTPEGKSIGISFAETNLPAGKRRTDRGTIHAISVSVTDQGVGIPEDEFETVFDKFVQSSKTRSGAGGTGLGLAICKEIIEGHGGKIYSANNPEGGANFTFVIPRRRVAVLE